MFFGYTLLQYEQFYVPFSDIEKTLIDLVYFGIKVPDEVTLSSWDDPIFSKCLVRLGNVGE